MPRDSHKHVKSDCYKKSDEYKKEHDGYNEIKKCKKQKSIFSTHVDLDPILDHDSEDIFKHLKKVPEKKTVTHCFKVTLGECKVSRDVKITHCINASYNHHIKENVLCKHDPCTKNTKEEKNTVVDGHECKAKFPHNEHLINHLSENSDKQHKHHKNEYLEKKQYRKPVCKRTM